jgi:DUF1707 SHOCT-like domain
MRASDVERQRAVEELRRHCTAGRLDVDEYASRIERAMGAATLEELDQLLSDLPMLRIAEPAGLRANSDRAISPRAGTDPGADRSGRLLESRLIATIVVLLSIAVVVGAVVVTIVGFWAWALVLVAGWLIGLAQGRLRRPK